MPQGTSGAHQCLDEPLLSVYENDSQYPRFTFYEGQGVATLATTGFQAGSNRSVADTGMIGANPRPSARFDEAASVASMVRDPSKPEPLPVYERSVYQPSRRSGPVALIASAGTVLAILGGLMTLNMVSGHEERARLTVMSLRELDTRPKVTPPPQKLEKAVETPPVAFVPKPEIQLPSSGPVKVAIDAPPPPVPLVEAVAAQPVKAEAAAAPASSSASPQEGGDLSGKALFIKPPTYPVEARRRHEQGTVKLLVLVGTDGRVADIEIAGSSGSHALDKAALRAVKQWRWEPVTRNGTAMAVRGYVVIPFILKTNDA